MWYVSTFDLEQLIYLAQYLLYDHEVRQPRCVL